jgi:hypothetical protein
MINDRLIFQRFLGLDITSKVPNRNTIGAFKENLTENYVGFNIFALFVQELAELSMVGVIR